MTTAAEIAQAMWIVPPDLSRAAAPRASPVHGKVSPPQPAAGAAAMPATTPGSTRGRVGWSSGLHGEDDYALQSKSLSGECAIGIVPRGADFIARHSNITLDEMQRKTNVQRARLRVFLY